MIDASQGNRSMGQFNFLDTPPIFLSHFSKEFISFRRKDHRGLCMAVPPFPISRFYVDHRGHLQSTFGHITNWKQYILLNCVKKIKKRLVDKMASCLRNEAHLLKAKPKYFIRELRLWLRWWLFCCVLLLILLHLDYWAFLSYRSKVRKSNQIYIP